MKHKRIAVIGATGSGKTTLAKKLSKHYNIKHIELDKLLFNKDKQRLSDEDFRHQVGKVAAQPEWICDGIFYNVADILWQRADLVVWVDTSLNITFRRVLQRSIYRITTKSSKPGGQRETLKTAFGKQGIIRMTPHIHKNVQREYPRLIKELELETKLVRLTSRKEIASFFATLKQ